MRDTDKINKISLESFIETIKFYDYDKLPGREAHLRVMPIFDNFPYRSMKPRADSMQSAVMLLFVPDEDNDISIILTIRSETIASHKGQISFPGGKIEDGETPLEAAFREVEEEIGVPSNSISVLAQISDFYVMPSNSVVKPFIGIIDKMPDFIINEDEVQELILVKLNYLMNPDNLIMEDWEFESFHATVPHWKVHHSKNLWGATAMMLSEVLQMLS
ncbi:MAG: hypothetical protein A2X64_05750 [Ignavibacteria bacterium GWF2_33_9]|nr:MAG: hypothetical protein A2X64_05750 [Ignavibacteria bacterium GWF2_33_9]